MIFLVDHNLEGHSLLLSGNMASLGWLDLLPIRFITFAEVALSVVIVSVFICCYKKIQNISYNQHNFWNGI